MAWTDRPCSPIAAARKETLTGVQGGGAASGDERPGEGGRQAEPAGASNDTEGTLAAHQGLGDDAADGERTFFRGVRGTHENPALPGG